MLAFVLSKPSKSNNSPSMVCGRDDCDTGSDGKDQVSRAVVLKMRI